MTETKKMSKSQIAALTLAGSKASGKVSAGGSPGRFRSARATLRSLNDRGFLNFLGAGSGHGPAGLRGMCYTYRITDAGRLALAVLDQKRFEIPTCPVCGDPAHAAESDDNNVHGECQLVGSEAK